MDDEKIVQLYWDREDADECVNDAYMSAWGSMPPHRPGVLSAFLGKIVRNLSLNRYRRNTAAKRGGGEAPAVLEEIGELVSGRDSVEQEIDRRELVRAVDAFLGGLPAEKRCIFVRYLRVGISTAYPILRARFQMTENHVSVTLNRLRAKLCRDLKERGFDL